MSSGKFSGEGDVSRPLPNLNGNIWSIWKCPRCRGSLSSHGDGLKCADCAHDYAQIDGIPDLRIPGDSWIENEEDTSLARELAALHLPIDGLVRAVYARRPDWDAARVELRTQQVLSAPAGLAEDIDGWLQPLTETGVFLDLGCGPGMLLAAAAQCKRGGVGIGIDVSMTWLVVAKRLIAAYGGTPILAAALGEALPLADGALDGLISLDVIEHVHDPETYLEEIDRVTAPRSRLALSMPNRFSLTPEPHVFVWGVGWLPRPFQAPYVRWWSGKTYDDTVLFSSFTLQRRLAKLTGFDCDIIIPPVSNREMKRFSGLKAWLARQYNRLCRSRFLRMPFLMVGPYFRAVGQKTRVAPA